MGKDDIMISEVELVGIAVGFEVGKTLGVLA
jgi:hypothetical protein